MPLRRADVINHGCDIARRNDFADHIFDARENLFALFEPRAGRRVHVQAELTGIDGWKEVASDNRQDHERAGDEDREQNKDRCAILERPGQRIDITLPQIFEALLERLLNPREEIGRRFFAFVTANQILHHHRHERAREQIGREHREHDGERQRREQIFRRPSQKHDRHEDDTNGQRGDERRHRDLLCAVENRPLDRFTLRQVAMDVFDLDRCVVDQNTDGERETAQRHYVERVAEQTQDRQTTRGSTTESRP